MNKKTYIQPTTTIFEVESTEIMQYSMARVSSSYVDNNVEIDASTYRSSLWSD